jgi:DNA-binding PadR family transcriptional regulator
MAHSSEATRIRVFLIVVLHIIRFVIYDSIFDMRYREKRRALTELEGAALGVVVRDGPCTSYAVKKLFLGSPSEFWSGSAGAIYPLIRRLEERGLVVSEKGSTGRRERLLYRVTSAGRREFLHWLSDAERAAGMGFDPLRTRLVFLHLLPQPERGRFRDDVRDALARIPHPLPLDDSRLETLHRIWIEARSSALERAFAELDDGDQGR